MGLTKYEQKKILKTAKKISPVTIVLLVAFFAFGLLTGFLAMGQVCKNDTVELLGEASYTYQVGTGTTTYTEEGEYYIKYTFNHLKFGTVVKYRTITVQEGA